MKLMNRTALALLAGALFALNAQANVLLNPGAETGTLAGWTPGGVAVDPHVDSGSFDPGINPHSGAYDFLGGTGLQFTLTQSVPIATVTTPTNATVSFWQQGLNQGSTSDNSHVELVFFDFDHAQLGTATTAVVDSHDGAWTQGGGTFAIPLNTTSIDYVMFFDRAVGSDLDSFIDDNSLTIGGSTSAVPEPANGALLIAGLALIGRLARRRRSAR